MNLLRSLAVALVACAAVDTAVAQEPTVVIVVRHAERAGPSADPGLTPAGEARAVALALGLAEANVGAIVTTQYRRTQLTAAPLAQSLNLEPVVVEAGRDTRAHLRAVAAAVRRFPGKTVLVVGHSNTVPGIIAELGGPAVGPLCDSEYNNLFTLVLRAGGETTLIRSSFGDSNGPGSPACN